MTSRQKSLLKYVIAALLLCLILVKTDVREIGNYLQKISPLHFALALLYITLAQVAASFRMRFLFSRNHFSITPRFAVILFYVGALYNFLLPGGIGGDAYKVILAKKRLDMPPKTGISIMVADRASGLCILVFLLLASLYLLDISAILPYAGALITAGCVITLLAYLAGSKLLLRQMPSTMLLSLPYSLVTQGFWLLTLYDLWDSLGKAKDFTAYCVLYGASSIASMLPVSVGGLGIKEMTYFYGAQFINHHEGTTVDGKLGVAISLCIFALSFIAALPGTLWLNKVSKTEI